ncbi:MAG: hypothetical protein ACKVQV_14155 [Bacteroidia bacterium]
MSTRVISYRLFDFLEFLWGTASLLISILGIWVLISGRKDDFLTYAFIVIILIFLATITKVFKLRQVALNRLTIFSKTQHDFSDSLRNSYYELMSLYINKDLTVKQLNKIAKDTCQSAVDMLADALSKSTGDDVCVSIKYFPPLPSKNAPKTTDDYVVATLVRSNNSPEERSGHDLVRVGDNTGFQLLVSYQYNHFRAQDLEILSKELEKSGPGAYKTSNPRWRDFYRSVITVPIRINRSYLPSPKGGDGYHIIGLLCADSNSTSAFPTHEMEAYTNFLKGYADILYIYLEKIDYYLTQITSQKKTKKR